MDKKYWDEVALVHDEKIFDVFSNDKAKVIQKNIIRFASRSKSAMDLGCAIGNWLPLLSKNFGKVLALDISQHYLDLAQKKNKGLKNVTYIHQDLSDKKKALPKADFVVCINTLLTPNAVDRNAAYNTVIKAVKKNGYLVLVVPALESALYSEHILDVWDAKDNEKRKKKVKPEPKRGNPFEGTMELDGTPTKHYLREELRFMLEQSGFEVEELCKVKYTWNTEFNNPPAWLKAPFPWDWLVVAKKK